MTARSKQPGAASPRAHAATDHSSGDLQWNDLARQFASLHGLLEEQFSQIDERLAQLGVRAYDSGPSPRAPGATRVLALRNKEGRYKVQESEIIAELADLHGALSSSLRAAEATCLENFSDVETAGILRDLADHHKKDASMLRALLWEDSNHAT